MTNRAGRRRRHKERSARSWIVTWLTPPTKWATVGFESMELRELAEACEQIQEVKRALWAAMRFPRF